MSSLERIKSLSSSLSRFREHFDHQNVDKKKALQFAAELSSLSHFITSCYSASTGGGPSSPTSGTAGSIAKQNRNNEEIGYNSFSLTPKSTIMMKPAAANQFESAGGLGCIRLVEPVESAVMHDYHTAVVNDLQFPLTPSNPTNTRRSPSATPPPSPRRGQDKSPSPSRTGEDKSTPKSRSHHCGVGYSSADGNEKALTDAVKEVIVMQMRLPGGRLIKRDMFHYMAHSTILHLLQCCKDKWPSFSDRTLMEWVEDYQYKGYEAMKLKIQAQPLEDSSVLSPTGSPNAARVIVSPRSSSVPRAYYAVTNAITYDGNSLATFVYELLKKKATKWNDIGRELRVSYMYREELEKEQSMSSKSKLEKVLMRWAESKCSEVSMRSVKKVMEELEFNDILYELIREST